MKTITIFVLLPAALINGQQTEGCDEGYECVPANDCEFYKEENKRLQTLERKSSEFKSLLKQLVNLRCNRKPPKFCCKIEINNKKFQIRSYKDSPSWVPSIDKEECGIPGSQAAFIVGGENTELGEYPWMALLGARNNGGALQFTCAGALINKW